MWLSALSKRTPRAYFIYTIVVLIILTLPQLGALIGLKQVFKNAENNGAKILILSPLIIPIVSFLLSILLNRVYVVSDTFKRSTLWPGYLFSLLVVAFAANFTVFQIVTHGFLGVLISNELLKIHYNKAASFQIYNIGLILCVAILLDTPMLILIPIMLYALFKLKPLSFKETILYFLGICTPIYFLYAYCFLVSDFSVWTKVMHSIFDWFQFNNKITMDALFSWVLVSVVLLFTLIITFYDYNSLSVYYRRLSSAFLYLIGGVFIIAFANQFSGFLIFYLAPTFAFFATMLMLRYTNKRIVAIIHFIFVSLIIGIQLVNNYLL